MSDSSKVFDRVTVLISIVGVLVLATTLVVAARGPAAGAAGADGTTVDVDLAEFSIRGELAVPVGQVSLRVTDSGTVAHNLSLVDGPSTPDLNAGQSSTLNLGELAAGTYELLCTIPGHETSGMTGFLTVRDAETSSENAGQGESADYAAMDAAMMEASSSSRL